MVELEEEIEAMKEEMQEDMRKGKEVAKTAKEKEIKLDMREEQA